MLGFFLCDPLRRARPTGGDRVPTGEHPGRGFLRQSLEGFRQAFAGLERLELLLAWLRAPLRCQRVVRLVPEDLSPGEGKSRDEENEKAGQCGFQLRVRKLHICLTCFASRSYSHIMCGRLHHQSSDQILETLRRGKPMNTRVKNN